MFGFFKPTFNRNVPGGDVAGTIVKVGSKVTRFKENDQVFGDVSGAGFGGFGEYVAVSENALAKKPENLSFEQAGCCGVACMSAFQAVEDCGKGISKDSKVLVIGASGGVGSFITQIVAEKGAHVVGVCSTKNVEKVKELGCSKVIDYKVTDVLKEADKYDFIFDCAATRPFEHRAILQPKGSYVLVGANENSMFFKYMFLAPFKTSKAGKKFIMLQNTPNVKAQDAVAAVLARGNVKPMMDEKKFNLENVAEAVLYVETKHASGKVAIHF